MKVDVVIEAGATIGEAPTWAAREKAVYWIDVKKPALYRHDTVTGAARSWPMPSDIGAYALLSDRTGAVVAVRDGIFRLDFDTANLTQLAPPPFDPKLFRFNEGACDATGRFWVGVMFDPLEGSAAPQASSLHSFTLAGGLRPEPDASELHNGMAWSPGGRKFYLTHSKRGEIYVFRFEPESGRINDRRLFAKVPESEGVPDGAAVDVDGGYWCALHGAYRLRRYRPDGVVDRDIELPVSQPTMCAFAGPLLDEFYVTSAREKLPPDQLRREPLAGALLRLRPGAKGIARHCRIE
jgi:sugar lactone lactonase YvrE